MTTIEQRVQRYCADECPNASKEVMTLICRSFEDGAKSEHAELTRWHDPKEELPEHRKQVLAKTDTENYDVAYYSDNVDGWIANDGIYNTAQIIGWREIHE